MEKKWNHCFVTFCNYSIQIGSRELATITLSFCKRGWSSLQTHFKCLKTKSNISHTVIWVKYLELEALQFNVVLIFNLKVLFDLFIAKYQQLHHDIISYCMPVTLKYFWEVDRCIDAYSCLFCNYTACSLWPLLTERPEIFVIQKWLSNCRSI